MKSTEDQYPESDDELYLTPEDIAELDRRVAEYLADPSTALSWEQARKILFNSEDDKS